MVLFQMDYAPKVKKVYQDGEEMNEAIAWLVPSFAPLGLYHVTVTVHGKDKKDKHAAQIGEFYIQ